MPSSPLEVTPARQTKDQQRARYLRLDEWAAPAAKSASYGHSFSTKDLRGRSIEAESRKVNGQDAESLDRAAEH